MTSIYTPWIDFAGSLAGALLAGVIALIVMHYTTKQTREIQEENKHNAVQPLLVFCNNSTPLHKYQDTNKGINIYEIENIGNGCAKDVKISAEINGGRLFLADVMTLKKGQPTGIITVQSDIIHEMDRNEKLILHIDYSDIYGKEYRSIFELICDVNQFKTEKISFA